MQESKTEVVWPRKETRQRVQLSLSTTPSDTFEAISSKFVRARTPNRHVEVRRPISAHGANYMTSLANSPIGVKSLVVH